MSALPYEEKTRRYRECTQNLDVASRNYAVRKALCQIEIHTRCGLTESRQKTDRSNQTIQESSLYVDDAQRDSAYKTQRVTFEYSCVMSVSCITHSHHSLNRHSNTNTQQVRFDEVNKQNMMKRHSVAVELVQLEDRLVQLTSMKEILNHAQTNSMESLRDRRSSGYYLCNTGRSGLSIMERIDSGSETERNQRV